MLYPFKFRAQLFHKIWGGHTIEKWYDYVPDEYENVGEAWVISDVEKYPTEVCNGTHAGDSLQDLLEVYMDELVGGKVYDCFGNHFPLLMKFIDADDDLSIQVHPDDEYAMENEHSLGKTEMWYVMPGQGKSGIYLGWNRTMNASLVHSAISDGTLANFLSHYEVQEGDVAYIPAGTVHALLKGTIVAEIQENSDITYRLYDYNRVGNDGRMRPLKLDKALEVMDYAPVKEVTVTNHCPSENKEKYFVSNLKKTPYFTANILSFTQSVQRDYALLDSFVAYMCVEGKCTIKALDCEDPSQKDLFSAENAIVSMCTGEAVLVPAVLNDILLVPEDGCKLIEVYLEL